MRDLVQHVQMEFSRVYLGGITSLLAHDDGALAFLSFICGLTAIEALGGFLEPTKGNGDRFQAFIKRYFPGPYPDQTEALWKLRNSAVHGMSPGPRYGLVHRKRHLHLTMSKEGWLILNAEDFYAALVVASGAYFRELRTDTELRARFDRRTNDPETGVMVVANT